MKRILNNYGKYDEDKKDAFIETAIHELTHGFNKQFKVGSKSEDKQKENRALAEKILKNKKGVEAMEMLSFVEYLYRDTEQNARISGFAKEALGGVKEK